MITDLDNVLMVGDDNDRKNADVGSAWYINDLSATAKSRHRHFILAMRPGV
jgi:hypothetical protein